MYRRVRLWAGNVGSDRREFLALWAIAALAYGAGDVLTTMVLLSRDPTVVETNALVVAATEAFGTPGLVGLKITVFVLCLGISVWASGEGDRVLYYLPPAVLALVGAFTTAMNARLLLG